MEFDFVVAADQHARGHEGDEESCIELWVVGEPSTRDGDDDKD